MEMNIDQLTLSARRNVMINGNCLYSLRKILTRVKKMSFNNVYFTYLDCCTNIIASKCVELNCGCPVSNDEDAQIFGNIFRNVKTLQSYQGTVYVCVGCPFLKTDSLADT